MKLTSPAFGHNQMIPSRYTHDGEDISPPLVIREVPWDAKSLALVVNDPDAPMGNWDHWLVWNISPTTDMISEAAHPEGSQEGLNSFGNIGYGGPSPPNNQTHRYYFVAYALNATLSLKPGSHRKELQQEIKKHVIDYAELIGLYHS
jgi:Raf kinase inhibitor-like YbhB/YbcL family protein